jgi:hypothetical protein
MEFVILYLVVAVGICGFIGLSWYIAGLQYQGGLDVGASETEVVWTSCGLPRRVGKTYPRGGIEPSKPWPRFGDIRWQYDSAYIQGNTVTFDDPADAYEYCIRALASKNKRLDKLENKVHLGMPQNYEWLWIDTHIERGYWLTQLNEFKEDV